MAKGFPCEVDAVIKACLNAIRNTKRERLAILEKSIQKEMTRGFLLRSRSRRQALKRLLKWDLAQDWKWHGNPTIDRAKSIIWACEATCATVVYLDRSDAAFVRLNIED